MTTPIRIKLTTETHGSTTWQVAAISFGEMAALEVCGVALDATTALRRAVTEWRLWRNQTRRLSC